MECGDSSPLWTGQFIGPHGTACGGGGGEINFAVKSGTEVPHSGVTQSCVTAGIVLLLVLVLVLFILSLSLSLSSGMGGEKEKDKE
jgi:hypothetical protein